MTTLVTHVPHRQRAVVVIYFKTGSRFETKEENGLSHFVEHMVFRGTNAHPNAHQLSTAFEELGGTLDASTAADHGTFGINVPQENLVQVLPLIGEVLRAPLFGEMEIERGIIREEILEDLGDQGELIDPASLARKLAFGNSGLGQPITGSLSNVERFTQDQLRSHHRKTYIGNDLVVSVAGPFQPDEISRLLESCFSSIPRGTSLSSLPPKSQKTPRFLSVCHPGSGQTSLSLSFRCPGATHPLEAAVEMLLRVIDDGMATRLYHRLCDTQGLCYSVSGSYEAYQETGLVELEADAAHERTPLVLSELLNLCDCLRQQLITEQEFARLQKRTRWQHLAFLDELGLSADFFAQAELSATAKTPAERLEELLNVTREDIRNAASALFTPDGRNTVCIGNHSGKQRESLQRLALGN